MSQRSLESLSDETILLLHESIRRQFEADRVLKEEHRFVGNAIKERATLLEEELRHRGKPVQPIIWL